MTAECPLILYSRPGCHLCEQVVVMLERCGISWWEVNIDDDPELQRRYALRVPVLKHSESEQELAYPFGEVELRQFASQ